MRYLPLAAALLAGAVHAQSVSVPATELAQLQRDARTARDVQQIQNVMSRRAMLHSIGHNEEELELWSRKGEIRWAQNGGCWIGDDYRKYYVTVNYAMQRAALKKLSAGNPAVADDFARNRYIGSSVYHLLTTPIIEVAQDGQSAKGFWYTPGAILSTSDGRKGDGVNMWERYGVDFVREDGQWRILHIEVITDFAYPFGGDLQSAIPGAPDPSKSGSESAAAPAPGPGAEGIQVPGPTVSRVMGESYSPTRVPRLTPRLPEPYRTLNETFQYADCRASPTSAAAGAPTAAPQAGPISAPAGGPPMGDPSKNPDMMGFAKEVDANHDGRLSRAEWQAKGLPSSSFNMFEAGRGYVTLEDYQKNAAPPGIDINGDGKLTVAEFKQFDAQGAARRGGPPRR